MAPPRGRTGLGHGVRAAGTKRGRAGAGIGAETGARRRTGAETETEAVAKRRAAGTTYAGTGMWAGGWSGLGAAKGRGGETSGIGAVGAEAGAKGRAGTAMGRRTDRQGTGSGSGTETGAKGRTGSGTWELKCTGFWLRLSMAILGRGGITGMGPTPKGTATGTNTRASADKTDTGSNKQRTGGTVAVTQQLTLLPPPSPFPSCAEHLPRSLMIKPSVVRVRGVGDAGVAPRNR